VSGRFPHDRIIAVEMLRGPDHMAILSDSFDGVMVRSGGCRSHGIRGRGDRAVAGVDAGG
jgi:hypothetical protein